MIVYIEEFLLEFKVIIQVHHQMEEQELEKAMLEINYHAIRTLEHILPNGKISTDRTQRYILHNESRLPKGPRFVYHGSQRKSWLAPLKQHAGKENVCRDMEETDKAGLKLR